MSNNEHDDHYDPYAHYRRQVSPLGFAIRSISVWIFILPIMAVPLALVSLFTTNEKLHSRVDMSDPDSRVIYTFTRFLRVITTLAIGYGIAYVTLR